MKHNNTNEWSSASPDAIKTMKTWVGRIRSKSDRNVIWRRTRGRPLTSDPRNLAQNLDSWYQREAAQYDFTQSHYGLPCTPGCVHCIKTLHLLSATDACHNYVYMCADH